MFLLHVSLVGPRVSRSPPNTFLSQLNHAGLSAPGLLPTRFHCIFIMLAWSLQVCFQHVFILFDSCWPKVLVLKVFFQRASIAFEPYWPEDLGYAPKNVSIAVESCWPEGTRAASTVFPWLSNYASLRAPVLLSTCLYCILLMLVKVCKDLLPTCL